MSLEFLKEKLPEYAKDLKLNLSALAQDETLNPQQIWGAFVATALAGRNHDVIWNVVAEAQQHLSVEAMEAAKAAAAIMAMNNVYYKFTGMIGKEEYRTLPAKLRMNIIGKPGIEKADFELWSMAVSAVNGCKYCMLAHEKQLKDHGFSTEQVQTSIRIASVMQAISAILDGVDALAEGK